METANMDTGITEVDFGVRYVNFIHTGITWPIQPTNKSKENAWPSPTILRANPDGRKKPQILNHDIG